MVVRRTILWPSTNQFYNGWFKFEGVLVFRKCYPSQCGGSSRGPLVKHSVRDSKVSEYHDQLVKIQIRCQCGP